MTPALGSFEAILSLLKRSCLAWIQVHEGVQMPLLSYGLCRELAIISTDFPKPILQVTHVKRCTELPLNDNTPPAEDKDYF